MQIVIRRVDDVGIVEIDAVLALVAVSTLAYEQHVVALAIDGKVASLSKSLDDAHLLCCDRDDSSLIDLTDNRYMIT